jgi:predicted nucleotidyltransferase
MTMLPTGSGRRGFGSMFGSMAPAEAGRDSNVDLLAEIDQSAKFSLIDLVGLPNFLADLIGRKVEVGTSLANSRPASASASRPT